MATLHVRNVPDRLYEALRVGAAMDGRSIGAQAVHLLESMLMGRAQARESLRRTFALGAPQARFAKPARSAVVLAQEEARALGQAEVDTDHLLLGLLRASESVAAGCLARLGITFDVVRGVAVQGRGAGDEPPKGALRFSPYAKEALELALREALALKHRHIGPEHVLLGIAGVEKGRGARVLSDLGADRDTIRGVLLAGLAAESVPVQWPIPAPAEEVEWEYRALALSGSEEEWTQALNGLAAEGWELMTLADQEGEPRAVFRRAAGGLQEEELEPR